MSEANFTGPAKASKVQKDKILSSYSTWINSNYINNSKIFYAVGFDSAIGAELGVLG